MFRNYSQVIKISHTDRLILNENICNKNYKNTHKDK